MATAEQIKSLIRSHLNNDAEMFYTVVLQVAAYEAQQGHGALAHDIREIVTKDRRARSGNALARFPNELAGMVFSEQSVKPFSALVLPTKLKERINRIIHEHRQSDKLRNHGLVRTPSDGQRDKLRWKTGWARKDDALRQNSRLRLFG